MAGQSFSFIVRLLQVVLGPLLKAVTPLIKDGLKEVLQKLYVKAEATPNPIDDIFVGLLLDLLSIDRP